MIGYFSIFCMKGLTQIRLTRNQINLTLQIRSTRNSLTLRNAYSVDKSMFKANKKVNSDFGPYRKIIDIDSR